MAQVVSPAFDDCRRTTTQKHVLEAANLASRHTSTYNVSHRQSILDLIPTAAWDSHMHIIDPTRYPLTADAQYKPSLFTVEDAQQFEHSIGVHTIVLVQPSIYGVDNSCLLAALRELGPDRARAVVACDPAVTSLDQLKEWHMIGVRGVRINLKSVGETPDPDTFARELQQCADLIRPLGWVLDLHISMALLPFVEAIMPSLDVKICLDHFACPTFPKDHTLSTELPTPPDPFDVEGFNSLLRLVKGGRTWVKMSAAYRLTKTTQQKEMLRVIWMALLEAGPNRLIWASDWPHTRYEGLDIRPFLIDCIEWCEGNTTLKNKLFRDNAAALWA